MLLPMWLPMYQYSVELYKQLCIISLPVLPKRQTIESQNGTRVETTFRNRSKLGVTKNEFSSYVYQLVGVFSCVCSSEQFLYIFALPIAEKAHLINCNSSKFHFRYFYRVC